MSCRSIVKERYLSCVILAEEMAQFQQRFLAGEKGEMKR